MGWGLLSLVLVAADASAAELPLSTRFAVERWAVDEGLPQSSVTDIVQTPDGYLWLATFGGLARFDGVRFRVGESAAPSVPDVRLTALAVAEDGSLWIGGQYGGIARVPGGVVPVNDPGTVWDLTAHGSDVWAASDGGVFRCGLDGCSLVASSGARALASTDDGLWLAGPDLRRATGGELELQLPDEPVLCLALDPSTSVLWVGTAQGLRARAPDGAWTLVALDHAVATVLVDRAGRLWTGDGDGELRLIGRAEAVRRLADHGAPVEPRARWSLGSHVRSLFEDREGIVWVGTDGRGLVRLTELPFARYADGLRESSVRVVDASGPEVVAAAGCESLDVLRDGRFEPVLVPFELGCVASLERSRSGDLWIGHEDEVARLSGAERYRLPARVLALHEDDGGTLWIGTDGAGVWTLRSGELTALPGLEDEVVFHIATGPDDAVWFALWAGVAALRDGALRIWSESDGMPRAQARAVHPEPDGTAWVGTYGGGLVHVGGAATIRLDQAQGLPEDVVSVVIDDGRGFLWVNGNRGVHRIARAELTAVVAGEAEVVRAVSFPTGEGNGGSAPAASVDAGGRLWFATLDGVVVFDPDTAVPNATPPIPLIEQLVVDGTSWPAAGGWQAPPGHRDLTVRFTAAALRDPRNTRFRYRLSPDTEWTDWVSSARREVTYRRLPPGAYRFELIAGNEAGLWSEVPARAEFVLRPRLSEMLSFRALMACAVLGLSAALVAIRLRATRRRNEMLRAEIERRRAIEAELRTSETHYRGTFEAASDALVVTTAEGAIVDANQSAVALFGRGVGAMRGASLSAFVSDTGARPEGIRADGTRFAAKVSTVPLGSDLRLTSVVDLEPEIAMQRRLAVAERVEAIGRLAGGVAHDINNLLTVVRANAELLRGVAPAAPEATEAIEAIDRAAGRGAEITRDLLSFGQRQLLRADRVSVASMLADLERSLRPLIPDAVVLRVAPRDARDVRSDHTQLELAIVNLVINAVDAMPDGGALIVEADTVSDLEAQSRWSVPAGRDWTVLSVTDTGKGIEPDVLPRVFEPFFTTKEAGTGLGLASVHGFARQSNGFVFVRSEVGQGTRVDLLLPALERLEADHPPSRRRAREPDAGGIRAIVCDDEPLVLRSIAMLLRGAGFDVRTASRGTDALTLLEAEPADVLITDVLMPGMNGAELARSARERIPDLPVVFVTGYAREVGAEQLDGEVLVKPFTRARLLDVVRRALP